MKFSCRKGLKKVAKKGRKIKSMKKKDAVEIANPVAKHAFKINSKMTHKDKTKYSRKRKHKHVE